MTEAFVKRQHETARGEFKTPARDVYVYLNSENNGTFGAGICRIPPGSSNEKHAHGDADEVIYIISGQMRILVGEDEHLLEQGDAVFIPRGNVHHIFNPSDSEELVHSFTFGATGPADSIGNGYGVSDNFVVHPPQER